MHNVDLDYMMAIEAPERAKEAFLSEFEAAWKYRTFWQGTWHCFVSGRIARLDAIQSMIEHILDKGEVWVAPLEEISAHVRQVVADGTYRPSVQTLPIKDGRIPDIPDPVADR